jgi:putative membrane protein
MYEGHWFGGGGMWIFWAAFILFILWGAKGFSKNNAVEKQQSALEILKERYAKGDIDQQEYEDKKRDLT